MAHTIWVMLMGALCIALIIGYASLIGGSVLAVISVICTTWIGLGALIGGFIGFMFTHGSVDALIISAVIGGVIGGLFHHGPSSLIKIIIWTLVGVGVGSVFGMMIVFGIVGFVVGLVRAF